jgi:hypothetical protein
MYRNAALNDQKFASERLSRDIPTECRYTCITHRLNPTISHRSYLPFAREAHITHCRFHKTSHEASTYSFSASETYNYRPRSTTASKPECTSTTASHTHLYNTHHTSSLPTARTERLSTGRIYITSLKCTCLKNTSFLPSRFRHSVRNQKSPKFAFVCHAFFVCGLSQLPFVNTLSCYAKVLGMYILREVDLDHSFPS